MKNILCYAILFLCLISFGCNQHGKKEKNEKEPMDMKNVPALDIKTIESATGMKGKENKGEYKITVPQNDLQVVVDNFKIIPAMGLSSWAAFTPSLNGAMVMGDIILTENDLKPVQQEVIRQGLAITAIHNHFVR